MTTSEKIEDHGESNARGWYESICEMLEKLDNRRTEDDAREEIEQSALDVEVSAGWHSPGAKEASKPTEYRILLTTGGPALRLVGDLNQWCEPENAKLQIQDWFKPWSDWSPDDDAADEKLLRFAQCFYFGE